MLETGISAYNWGVRTSERGSPDSQQEISILAPISWGRIESAGADDYRNMAARFRPSDIHAELVEATIAGGLASKPAVS
jgi:hypothetical protein